MPRGLSVGLSDIVIFVEAILVFSFNYFGLLSLTNNGTNCIIVFWCIGGTLTTIVICKQNTN